MAVHQVVNHDQEVKLFLFDEVYPLRAAQEQANKKKLGAFGTLAKWNPLNRPKDDTVRLAQETLRFEPFWHVVVQRALDYTCQVTYPVPVHNPYAQSLSIDTADYEVTRQGDKARIDLVVRERCHRKIGHAAYLDGMDGNVKPASLAAYTNKYKFTECDALSRSDLFALRPLKPRGAVVQQTNARLNGEPVNAHDILSDAITYEKLHMYLRPVFAFEFIWSSEDRKGVIEVDGLTGEVTENGRWFKESMDTLLTRENLFDLGAEVAGSFVPGGSMAVKLLGKVTEPKRATPA